MSHQSPKLYIRSVINSWGQGFSLPIMNVSPAYFNRKIEESKTKQNPQLLDSPPTCRDRGGGGAGRAAAPPLFCAPAPTFGKSHTMILFLFSIFNMKKLFSIVSPPTFHLVPRSLTCIISLAT